MKSYFQLKSFSFFVLLPSSSPSLYIVLAKVLKATWMEKLSWLHIKINILSGFQVVLMDVVYQVISVSLFKIHKTKCTPSNGKINQIIYIQSIPKCLKETSAACIKKKNDKCFAGSFFLFLYHAWNHFWKEKRVYCGHFYFNKIAS